MLSWHENYLRSAAVLGGALLLAVSRLLDKIGFVVFPIGCISLNVGDVVH